MARGDTVQVEGKPMRVYVDVPTGAASVPGLRLVVKSQENVHLENARTTAHRPALIAERVAAGQPAPRAARAFGACDRGPSARAGRR